MVLTIPSPRGGCSFNWLPLARGSLLVAGAVMVTAILAVHPLYALRRRAALN